MGLFMFKYEFTAKFIAKVLAVSLLIVLLLSFYFIKSNKEIVYVDSVKLFDGFVMTKEMKKVGEKEFNSRKAVLDNLYATLQNPETSEAVKAQLMQEFVRGKEEFHQFEQAFISEESSKIWKRIKSYSSEFSKDKDYKLIIGSNSQSNVLFADDEIDVTDDLLIYLNKKYEGLN
ncbi:OmpH family outer membrane protein [Flavobacterium sp. Fl-318]|uniref:OmpH family outer membrane protein n=2 Tax=Flavobacterium cupriresistens TaxID=2893885 RepID=A0ABU4RGB0_9FLAO|nr:OmpH family outer membrane protein [Flavobacterium sp. Fl-318]